MPWIFRYPDSVVERLTEESSGEWIVRQHMSLMSPGDLVFFWEGDNTGKLVGVGRTQTQPYRSEEDLRRFLVRIGRNLVLRTPLSAKECAADAVLAKLSVLQRSDQTNYGLSRAHTDRLLAVIGSREPGFAKAMNLPPDRFPKIVEDPDSAEAENQPQEDGDTEREDSVVTDELAQRANEVLNDPVANAAVLLRRIAHEQLREALTPESLADIGVEEFDRKIASFGHLRFEGEDCTLAEAAEQLVGVGREDIQQMVADGRLEIVGNLTSSPKPSTAAGTEADSSQSLRLRAALQHLLSVNRPLNARIARMRKALGSLWPETATTILMALEPDEHIVYHSPAVTGLSELGIDETFRERFEDYERYRALAARIRDELNLTGMDEVDLILSHSALDADVQDDEPDTGAPVDEETPPEPEPGEVEREVPAPRPVSRGFEMANEGQAVFALYQHLRSAGVVVSLEQVVNLYLSMKTVPVLVIQGASGTGKNLVVRSMTEAFGGSFRWMPMTNETGRGPADAPLRLRDLFGQLNTRSGQYLPEPWFDAVLEARDNPDRAVVVCLDTPDGWQEESWFSEWLRLHDTRARQADGQWVTAPFYVAPGQTELNTPDGRSLPSRLPLPDNLFLVVTMIGDAGAGDVLAEHANVIEFGPPNLSLAALSPGHAPEAITPAGLGTRLVQQRPYRTIEGILDRPWVEQWNDEIEQVAEILEPAKVTIGYRVRDDILRYLAYADDLGHELPYGARYPLSVGFDFQLAQRIVPRVEIAEPEDEVVGELLMYVQGESGGRPRFPQAASQLEALHESDSLD